MDSKNRFLLCSFMFCMHAYISIHEDYVYIILKKPCAHVRHNGLKIVGFLLIKLSKNCSHNITIHIRKQVYSYLLLRLLCCIVVIWIHGNPNPFYRSRCYQWRYTTLTVILKWKTTLIKYSQFVRFIAFTKTTYVL